DASFTATTNNLTIASIIANDGASPVSVNVMGYVVTSAANTYTGGTFINQGRMTGSIVTAFGPAGSSGTALPSGEAFLNNNGTFAQNFTISGVGATEASGGQQLGAIRMNTGATTISGQITLAANARISGGSGAANTISGQITGPGRLELTAATGNNTSVTLSNAANNFNGGLQLTAVAGRQVVLKLGADNVIPDGASAGDVTLNGTGDVVKFDINSHNETINGLSAAVSANNQVTNSGATPATLTVGGNNASATFGGTITDSGANALSLV